LNNTQEIKSIIKYLKNCYEADSRGNQLTSIFASSIQHLHIAKEPGLFEGELNHHLVEKKYAQEINSLLQLFVKEKEYKAFFLSLKSKKDMLGKSKYVYTPLFLFDAKLVTIDEFDFVEIDRSSVEVNPVAVNIINVSDSEDNQSVTDLLMEIALEGSFNMASIVRLQKMIHKKFDNVSVSQLDKYPKLQASSSVKRIKIPENKQSILLPNAGFFVKTRSKGTQGILAELETLLKETSYNNAISSYLLGVGKTIEAKKNHPEISVPALLSKAQEKALNNIHDYNEMMIIGPPGTGKSYTISALAINEMYYGRSVLIVSSNPGAVSVIDDKIKSDFNLENLTTQISNTRRFKSALVRNLGKWLKGVGMYADFSGREKHFRKIELKKTNKSIKSLRKDLAKLEKMELKLGELILKNELGFFDKITRFWTKRGIKNLRGHSELYNKYLYESKYKIVVQQRIITNKFMARLQKALVENRKTFQNFRLAIKSRASGEKAEFFKNINFNKLTQVFPIWLAPINELHNALPFEKEMFDVVIFDEASQTDMASVLPILYRAKKVVVVGDPKQLRHVSFLSKAKQLSFAREIDASKNIAQKFDYRNTSFLDLFNQQIQSQNQVAFLDEHYRSLPGIISFSNRYFYDSSLRIMQDKPSNNGVKSQELVAVDGVRNELGENEMEANLIVAKCLEIIKSQNTDVGYCSSIGILSPFRTQIDFIKKKLTQEINAKDLAKHKIILGTAHAFQGDERDVMFISMCVDDDAHHGSFMHLNKDDIFNVSLTRAKKMQYIVHSIQSPKALKEESNLKLLLRADYDLKKTSKEEGVSLIDPILDEMIVWLEKLGFTVKTQAQIAGIEMDLLISNEQGAFFGIDIVGVPSEMGLQLSFDKIRILNQLELKIFPIALSDFVYNIENLEKALMEFTKSDK